MENRKLLRKLFITCYAFYYIILCVAPFCHDEACNIVVSSYKDLVEESVSKAFSTKVSDPLIIRSNDGFIASGTSIYPGSITSGTVGY